MSIFRRAMSAWVVGWLLAGLGSWAGAATFTVTTNAASGDGSLPWAITQANMTGGTNQIVFNLPGNPPIRLDQALQVTNPIIIDGQRAQLVGLAVSTSPTAAVFEFHSGSDGSEVRNLIVANGYIGLSINADNIKVLGCAIGTDYSGSAGLGNGLGLWVSGNNNQIGGPSAAERNIIAGNASYGILADAATNLRVQGNYIGVGPDGATSLSNEIGVMLRNGTVGALIGGDRRQGEGNVLSGNHTVNIYLLGETTTSNRLAGNIIGGNASLTAALNDHCGIGLRQASGNFIGLPGDGFENIIVGQSVYALYLGDVPRPRNNVVQNNYFGVTPDNASMPNGTGIMLAGADSNLIGGARGGGVMEGNVIAASQADALILMGDGNTVSGNYIGTDVNGAAAMGNITGVNIMGNGNLIGGENQGDRRWGNVISGQGVAYGIYQTTGADNVIQGNLIGLNAAGDAAIPNMVGIDLEAGARHTVIGGPSAAVRNVISGNVNSGIFINGSSGHEIMGNYIGLNQAGTAVVRNGSSAIVLNDASDCRIGGTTDAERNVICGRNDGIALMGPGATGNRVFGNWIGLLPDMTQAPDLFVNGISCGNSATANSIGLKEQGVGNLIVGGRNGVALYDAGTHSNGIFGNTITGFTSMGVALADNANRNKAEPEIAVADVYGVGGTAEPNDYVEVFQAARGIGYRGGSMWFVGAAQADAAGRWSMGPVDYRLRGGGFACAIATDGSNNSSKFSNNVAVTGVNPTPTVTAVATRQVGNLEVMGETGRVFPNPGKDRVQFQFNLAEAGELVIRVYNLYGEKVAEFKEARNAGDNQVITWDTQNIASGVYIVRFLRDNNEFRKLKFAIAR